ncbi:MAG: hypothetical protein D6706_07385 [Chloroflexi bacterium]|nr:MAG: hypothetical protein D6706_07385 [Chloroflexota bacterium]
MAAKGYCTSTDVDNFLGGTLTASQLTQADALIERAEAYLDGEIGRGWLEGAQTQEAHYTPAELLLLDYFPVASVTAVYGRNGIGQTETTLVDGEDYEVQDLAAGIIRLVYPQSYDRIRVTYVPDTATVPADIKQATIDLVAAWMQPTLRPGMYGVDSYSLPDLTVRFSRAHYQSVPPTVRDVIARYRVPEIG